jgi:hypothetical protein
MLEEGLRNVRKYVVTLDDPDKVLVQLDLGEAPRFDALKLDAGAE